MATQELMLGALNRLCKWRTVFASWQLGTRPSTDGECRAVKDHREVTIILRAEANALTALLVKKGVITKEEWTSAVMTEAVQLEKDYQASFPGFSATDAGISMALPAATETMKKLGFPS